jgi:hypothetical protein
MFRKYLAFLCVFLFASIAFADDRVVGHMEPFSSELLDKYIKLDCGAMIQEVRGGPLDYAKLNSLCSHARSNFFKFVDSKKQSTFDNREDKFTWNISFLPIGSCYRCLNDESYRFKDRFIKGITVTGYTDRSAKYSFAISNTGDSEFTVTFVHEMFHAMSMYYGVYENHPGDYAAKSRADETLAQEFTVWLGYGR